MTREQIDAAIAEALMVRRLEPISAQVEERAHAAFVNTWNAACEACAQACGQRSDSFARTCRALKSPEGG